ncbi:MAG TPA: AbrB/MazE/SpoVT family DNA-binding domain-containing protein [bacterium]|nr:AbrB/MazE/SpoVT family DNA-binding domain-containing protein [bacterium]
MGIVKIREKYQVTIPEDVRAKISCEVGEYVRVDAEGSSIVIKPLVVEEKFSPDETALLEKALKKQTRGRIMKAEEYKKRLEKL